MTKKRILIILLAFILLAASLSACGSGKTGSTAAQNAYDVNYSMAASADAVAMEAEEAYAVYAQSSVSVPAGVPDITDNAAKIIYTAELDMETTDFDAATAAISSLTQDCGGYFQSSRMSGGSGYRSAHYEVRIPAENYRDFISRAGELCHLTSVYEYTDDVSEAYYDTEGRLTTQQTKLARLQELLAEAKKMEDIILLESAISETEEQIDYLSGQLRRYDALVDYSTVTIWLDEVYRLSNVPEPVQGFGARLAAAFADGWHGFVDGMESLAIALAYGWLWLVLIVAVVIAVVFLCRRARKRRKEKKSEHDE